MSERVVKRKHSPRAAGFASHVARVEVLFSPGSLPQDGLATCDRSSPPREGVSDVARASMCCVPGARRPHRLSHLRCYAYVAVAQPRESTSAPGAQSRKGR